MTVPHSRAATRRGFQRDERAVCKGCGQPFTRNHPRQEYCVRKCSREAYRKRKGLK